MRVSEEIWLDLEMWVQFLSQFNGTTQFPCLVWQEGDALQFYSGSSGSHSCGVVFGKHWSCSSWSVTWPDEVYRDITFLELVPIVLDY